MGIFDNPMLMKQADEARRRKQNDEEKIIRDFCSPKNIDRIIKKIGDELTQRFVESGGIKPTYYCLEIGRECGADSNNSPVIRGSDECHKALETALRRMEPSVKNVSLDPTYESSTTHISIRVWFY